MRPDKTLSSSINLSSRSFQVVSSMISSLFASSNWVSSSLSEPSEMYKKLTNSFFDFRAALLQIARNTYATSPHLRGKPKLFFGRKSFGCFVNINSYIHSKLPCFQAFMWFFHIFFFPLSSLLLTSHLSPVLTTFWQDLQDFPDYIFVSFRTKLTNLNPPSAGRPLFSTERRDAL